MSSTRTKRVNTRSSSSIASNPTASDALLPPSTSPPKVGATKKNNNKRSSSKASTLATFSVTAGSKTPAISRSSARLGSKRKLSPSMENLTDDEVAVKTSPKKSTTNEEKSNSNSGEDRHSATNNNNRKLVERLIVVSKIYLDCELEVYDEKLHRSLDRMIERFDSAEADFDSTPDDLLPEVTERHLDLLNVRMKLLKLNGSGGSISGASSSTALATMASTANAAAENATTKTTNTQSVTPVDIDLNSNSHCFYCRGDHAPEKCEVFPLARRSNIIKKRKRCFRCLLKFTDGHKCDGQCTTCGRTHHVSLCKQDPATFVKKTGTVLTPAEKAARKAAKEAAKRTETSPNNRFIAPPITEPPLPTGAAAERLMTPATEPPLSIFTADPFQQLQMCLNTPNSLEKPIVYMPSVTLKVVSPSGSALGRAMINYSNGVGCFVAPRFLTRLNVKPTRLPGGRIAQVRSFSGQPYTVREYAMLEVRSLYRPAYRFRRLFYVLDDVSRHLFNLPTSEVSRMAEAKGVRLAHAFEVDPTHNTFDLVIGKNDIQLTGFVFEPERCVKLIDLTKGIAVAAYYTHFGYMLVGGEREEGDEGGYAGSFTGSDTYRGGGDGGRSIAGASGGGSRNESGGNARRSGNNRNSGGSRSGSRF